MVFVFALAIGNGLVMVNGGTLFRQKLQYLFPSFIVIASALPATNRIRPS